MISLGIDIGAYSLKVAEVEISGKEFRVRHLEEIPLSQDPNKDNEIEILDILRQLNSRYHNMSPKITVALPDQKVSFRRLFFPFKERHKILKSLPFELEDEIPFDQSECVFDSRISRFIDQQSDVFACACPKENLEKLLQQYTDAGIHPDAISVESLGLSNLFEIWRESPMEDTAEPADETDKTPTHEKFPAEIILDMGHRSTHLLVLKDGYLLETHNFDWGGADIVEAIAKKYSLHFVESLKEFRSKSFVLINSDGATSDQITFSDVIKGELKKLAQQLNLVLMDIKAQYQLDYTQLTLMGGVSQIKNLGPFLTQQLEVPCNQLKNVSLLSQLDFARNSNNELQCATAIGLAIEGLRKPKNPGLNLLRGEFAKQGQHFKLMWDKWHNAIKVAGAIYILLIAYGVTRGQFATIMLDKSSALLKTQAKKVANLSGSKATPRNIKKFIRKKQKAQKNRELIQSLQGINSPLDILKKISLNSPRESDATLDIKKFTVINEKVLIEGTISPKVSLDQFKEALESISKNGKVNKRKPQHPTAKGRNAFAYEFMVERNDGATL